MHDTQQTAKEVAFFDNFVAQHGEYDVLADGAYRRLLRTFAREIKPRPGERCIDLGCGTGAFTRRLRPFQLDLSGLDLSPASVEYANRQSTQERFLVGDITDTGFADGSYDIILYSGVLHHFSTPEQRLRVLREGFRILAPGGRMFAYDPNQHSPSMWLYRDPRSPLFSSEGKTENEVLLSRKQLTAELSEVGFSQISVRGLSGISYRYIQSKNARLMLPIYNLYELCMHHSPLERWLGTFVISCAVKR